MSLLIELHYFPSIIWYKKLNEFSHIKIDQYERFQKMSFRNRCIISGANGPMILSVPIAGGRNSKLPMNEVEIDYKTRWQDIHWRSIYSAYNRSPWFEFYKDEMLEFYQSRLEKLWDWNLMLFKWTIKKLQLDHLNIEWASRPKSLLGPDELDFRNKISPKNIHEYDMEIPRYSQVFEERHGFVPNLSIIDLLFSEGPKAGQILQAGT
ncbi:MAG: hypothetical protein C5B52_08250 [Bacteroidetes bacterium]|nr:MAG: hypothetical protein C5B52_08250 [Bacteroidota bacterium]